MNAAQQKTFAASVDCEVRFDDLSRQLYATDGSIYQIEPLGVAFPKTVKETRQLFETAHRHDVPIIPRGGGTGLAGAVLGEGLVVDFSRHQHVMGDVDLESRSVKVGPGVVLDVLNNFVKQHGLTFGPDVATSSRATLGGMIANNSSGARAPLYGTTIDHVKSLDIVLADGSMETIGPNHPSLPHIRQAVLELLDRIEPVVRERQPEGLVKRWPGYGFEKLLKARDDLTRLIGGSEGTLAAIVGAELNLVPVAERKGLGLIFFESVMEAMKATVELLDLKPVAIEHMDDVLFDQTKGQLTFERARQLLDLDARPCESILLVEFYDDFEDRLEALKAKNLGMRTETFTDPKDMEQVWLLRKAGLTLLTGCKGDAKPTSGIEDVAVRPHQLPEYVQGLQDLMKPLGLRGSFYGHAASGLLHVRPVVDLHKQEDVLKFRKVSDGVSELVKRFKASIAGEHGVGIARNEYLLDHLGPELMDAHKEVKALFDPKGLMNPGKLTVDSPYRFDANLRQGAGNYIELPFEPVLAFAAKDGSFEANLEQCNGCGGCRKPVPTMCPTFIATGDEIMSTRGRANAIRAALQHRLARPNDPLFTEGLMDALDPCLSCKGCTTECPSNVNLSLLKSELLHARHRARGVPMRDRLLSRVDVLGALASLAPGAANAVMNAYPSRRMAETLFGLSSKRPFPTYAKQRFDRWFYTRNGSNNGARGKVVLWDDCFVRYNEPNIGHAAVKVLEAAGYEVVLPKDRACCGRPAFSLGRLDLAKQFGEFNLDLLDKEYGGLPIIFVEPSCFSMFAEDLRELSLDHAVETASRSFLFEEFMVRLLSEDPGALELAPAANPYAIHVHCHAKSLRDRALGERLLSRIPGAQVGTMETGCCGMAGAFGQIASKYDLSMKVGEGLLRQATEAKPGTTIVASGTSCRHQLAHGANIEAKHAAEVLAEAVLEITPANTIRTNY